MGGGESHRFAMESAGSWHGATVPVAPTPVIPPPAEPAASPSDSAPSRVTLAEAVKAYLAVRSGSGNSSATLRKHKTFVKQLEAFAAGRGYVMLEQLTSRILIFSLRVGSFLHERRQSGLEHCAASFGTVRSVIGSL
jgi:hypothetical protein